MEQKSILPKLSFKNIFVDKHPDSQRAIMLIERAKNEGFKTKEEVEKFLIDEYEREVERLTTGLNLFKETGKISDANKFIIESSHKFSAISLALDTIDIIGIETN